MKKLLGYIRRKISVRVSLWVVIFAALIFVVALWFLFFQARETVRKEAINRATLTLDKTEMSVAAILNRVEVATKMTEWLVMRYVDRDDSMFVFSQGILRNNPDLFSCSIAFEPNHFKEHGRYFSAFSHRMNDSIVSIQEGSDLYDYFNMDWYMPCKLLRRPIWTEPYFDHNPNWLYSDNIIASYSRPLITAEGAFIGTISTDIAMTWLSKTVSAMKPYPHSYSIMLGKSGTYFVHPDTTKLFYKTIFTEPIDRSDTAKVNLGNAMVRGETGMKEMMLDGVRSYVFYKPLAQTGWSMAIVCPESDIFAGIKQLHQSVVVIVIAGLLLMLLFFIHIINLELNPLQQLAQKAEVIASGKLDTALPDLHRIDEIGQLSQSFRNMQQSLVKYIDELKRTTAEKVSIDRDIHIASDIQKGMLPEVFPTKAERDDVQLYASLIPAKQVGGDLFDFYFRDEKLFFCIGDVSGKGVAASLIMAVTRATFRTISAHESMPDRIVTTMNKTMADMNSIHMFVTLFVGVLDLPTGRLHYCNAGHNPPLLVGADVGELPCNANIPVGFRPLWKYVLQDIQIAPGTTIFLYTDGLTEAMDAKQVEFQIERVTQVATQALARQEYEPEQLINRMNEAVHQFAGDAEQSDDLTMMAIQYIRQPGDVQMRSSIVLVNNTQEIPRLTAFVNEVCESLGIDETLTLQINVAVEEAVANVIKYAYPLGKRGDVAVEAAWDDAYLKLTITDSGKPFDPTVQSEIDTTLPAKERNIGGLGIHIVRKVMDSINYEHRGNFNVLTLTKKIKH